MNFKKTWKRFFSLSRRNDGFTLVELIIVIAILAILAGVAVPAYNGYIEKANEAGDMQLLDTVNTAFAAAALENGDGIENITSAALTYGGAKGAVTVTGVAAVDNSSSEAYDASFKRYYEGNENATFKTAATLKFNPTTHLFEIFSTAAQQAAVDIFNNSNLAGKEEALASSVDNIAGLLVSRLEADGLDLLKNNMDSEEEYNAFMAKYGLTEESDKTEIANATVMYVASKMQGVTAQDIATLTKGDISNIGAVAEVYGEIPTAALMYGVVTGYANSGQASAEFLEAYKKAPTGISDVNTLVATMGKDANFNTYLKNPEKGAMADMDGYLAAMGVVNNYEGSFNLKDPDLFTSEETKELLESVLGSSASAND